VLRRPGGLGTPLRLATADADVVAQKARHDSRTFG